MSIKISDSLRLKVSEQPVTSLTRGILHKSSNFAEILLRQKETN